MDRLRQEDRSQSLARSKRDVATTHAAKVFDLRAHLVQVGLAPTGVSQEQLTRSRQAHPTREPLEDGCAQLLFQVLNATVDGGRRNVELFGCSAD